MSWTSGRDVGPVRASNRSFQAPVGFRADGWGGPREVVCAVCTPVRAVVRTSLRGKGIQNLPIVSPRQGPVSPKTADQREDCQPSPRHDFRK